MREVEGAAKVADSKRSAKGVATKVCPRCGEELFEDMGVCYGCLFDFDHKPEVPKIAQVEDLDEVEPWDKGLAPVEDDLGMEETQELPVMVQERTAGASVPAEPRTWRPNSLGVRVASGSMEATVSVERPIFVGRRPGCAITLRSPAVSRLHLRLCRVSEGVLFEDLEAKNPAMYRGRPIRGQVTLAPGDSVSVCGVRLTVVEQGGFEDVRAECLL